MSMGFIDSVNDNASDGDNRSVSLVILDQEEETKEFESQKDFF